MGAGRKNAGTGARLRSLRHEVDRKAPRRGATEYFREDESVAGTASRASGSPASAPAPDDAEDVVMRAVRLGYQVAEEQVRKSRRAADRVRRASSAVGRGDTGEALAQGVQAMRTLGEMLVDVVESAASNSQVWGDAVAGMARPGRQGSGSRGEADQGERDSGEAASASGPGPEPARAAVAELARQTAHWLRAVSDTLAPDAGGAGATARVYVIAERLASRGSLAFWTPPKGDAMHCDGLVRTHGGKTEVLAAAVSPLGRIDGAWEVTVNVRRGAAPGTYRGMVLAGEQPVGYLEVQLRKPD